MIMKEYTLQSNQMRSILATLYHDKLTVKGAASRLNGLKNLA